MNDKVLLDGLIAGKETAYRHLFKQYFEPLTYFANKYLQDIDAAQDLVQEVFSGIYEKRTELNIEQSLKSYLYRSIQNSSLNIIRRDKMKEKHHAAIKSSSDGSFTDETIELNELELKVHRAIDDLPEKCALIFKMSRFDQLSNQEIAEKLNISKRTVETQISKALKELRKVLTMLILEFFLKFL